MTGRATATLIALVAITALALPASAAAKPGYYVVPREQVEQFELPSSNGFKIVATELNGRAIGVNVLKKLPHSGSQIVSYELIHHETEGRLDFNLGGEGVFHLRFVAAKTKEEPPVAGCKGAPVVIEEGQFVGTIDFHGRHGYSRVEAKLAPGTITTKGREVCRQWKNSGTVVTTGIWGSSPWPPELQKGAMELVAGSRSGRLSFQAIRLEPEEDFIWNRIFAASIRRRRHGITMFSTAHINVAPRTSFKAPDPADPTSTATVEPPAPFSGSATFDLTSPTHAAFGGDLAVELPGFGRVPLTGDSFYAGICDEDGCTKTLPKRRP